jgi:hypothetical protein
VAFGGRFLIAEPAHSDVCHMCLLSECGSSSLSFVEDVHRVPARSYLNRNELNTQYHNHNHIHMNSRARKGLVKRNLFLILSALSIFHPFSVYILTQYYTHAPFITDQLRRTAAPHFLTTPHHSMASHAVWCHAFVSALMIILSLGLDAKHLFRCGR